MMEQLYHHCDSVFRASLIRAFYTTSRGGWCLGRRGYWMHFTVPCNFVVIYSCVFHLTAGVTIYNESWTTSQLRELDVIFWLQRLGFSSRVICMAFVWTEWLWDGCFSSPSVVRCQYHSTSTHCSVIWCIYHQFNITLAFDSVMK